MTATMWPGAVSDATGVAGADDRARSVDALEAAMMREFPPYDMEQHLVHRFAPHVYARELTIPAGILVTGKVHKTRHFSIISQGRVSVWTAQDGLHEHVAPCTFTSEPGTRRVVFAHETTVWTTIHPSEETDLATLEAEIIEPHENPLLCLPPTLLAVIR